MKSNPLLRMLCFILLGPSLSFCFPSMSLAADEKEDKEGGKPPITEYLEVEVDGNVSGKPEDGVGVQSIYYYPGKRANDGTKATVEATLRIKFEGAAGERDYIVECTQLGATLENKQIVLSAAGYSVTKTLEAGKKYEFSCVRIDPDVDGNGNQKKDGNNNLLWKNTGITGTPKAFIFDVYIDSITYGAIAGHPQSTYFPIQSDVGEQTAYQIPHYKNSTGKSEVDHAPKTGFAELTDHRDFPAGFVKNSFISATAIIHFEPRPEPDMWIGVEASGSGGLELKKNKEGEPVANNLLEPFYSKYTTGISISAQLRSGRAVSNTIKCFGAGNGLFELSWNLKLIEDKDNEPSGEVLCDVNDLPVTKSTVFVSGVEPTTGSAYHTLVGLACRGANGFLSDQYSDILNGIWNEFKNLSTKRFSDNVLMQYWGPISSENGIYSTSSLINNNDGRCEAWHNLLFDAINIICSDQVYHLTLTIKESILLDMLSDEDINNMQMAHPGYIPSAVTEACFYVYPFNAQGNAIPNRKDFRTHALNVFVNPTELVDPSYGIRSEITAEDDDEEAVLNEFISFERGLIKEFRFKVVLHKDGEPLINYQNEYKKAYPLDNDDILLTWND